MPSQELQRHDATHESGLWRINNGNTHSASLDGRLREAQGEEERRREREQGGERREREREKVLTGEAINVGQCCLKHPIWTRLARLFFPWSSRGAKLGAERVGLHSSPK
ncbi:hypothetical protein ACQKWADRAFT_297621 [Trichoderma austrokoningii]